MNTQNIGYDQLKAIFNKAHKDKLLTKTKTTGKKKPVLDEYDPDQMFLWPEFDPNNGKNEVQ